ncbi:WD40 repeat-like protein [Piromyces finnis]|uniref:Cilia- and flagella-associated protein 251 n=1 Tax=Piromyces finnis TaxID=1754191 RepID=A0A1Y1V4Y9_9FUNG|nr:WD40 repeat-like protein [Piromyces finnis]|eukprot:ORX47377.1 WD40 repeat-like protein [Piromyces finnis]
MSDNSSYVLNYKWAFGLNHKIKSGIQYLTSTNRNHILYASAHTGVIYDPENNKQFLLRGHCNTITCLCKSHDDHWVATADSGPDSLIIVWDTQPSLTLKQEQEYQQQKLRNEKNNQMMTDSQESETNHNNETISRNSSTDTIDFETLRANHNAISRIDILNENASDEEEEDYDEEKDIENEINNIITNEFNKEENRDINEKVINPIDKEEKNETLSSVQDTITDSSNSTPEKVDSSNEKKIEPNSLNESEKKENSGDAIVPSTTDSKSTTDMVEPINKELDSNKIENNNLEDMIEPLDDGDNNIFGEKPMNDNKKRKNSDDYFNYNEYDDLESLPIKTIINPHHNCGVIDMKMSKDSKYLVTLGADSPQTLCIWDWTTESEEPICEFTLSGEKQKYVAFNSSNPFELVSNGSTTIFFYTWNFEEGIKQHKPIIGSKELITNKIKYTYTIFIPNTQKALSATECGSIILWDNCVLMNLSKKLEDGNKSAIKIMKLHNGPINIIDIINDKYFITGGEDGFIRIYDFQYRLYIWLENINAGPVLSISFNKNRPGPSIVNNFNIPDFMVLTKHAKILHVYNGENEETNKQNNNDINSAKESNNNTNIPMEKKVQKNQLEIINASSNTGNLNDPNNTNGPNYDIDKFITISKFPQFKVILAAQYEKISAIESHPLKPEIAISGYSGLIQIYNYLTKELINQRLFEYEEEKKETKEKEKGLSSIIKKKIVKKVNKIESIAYSTKGTWIAIGFTNGSIKIVDSIKLTDIITTPDQTLQICSVQKPITQFAWSFDDSILAAADEDNGVAIVMREEINYNKKNINSDFKLVEIHGKCLSIFKDITENNNNTKDYYMGEEAKRYEWNFIGRYQSHWKKIIQILFMPSSPPRLLSLGQDRMIVEYDLENSSFVNGIKIKTKKQLEQTAVPSALCLNNTRNEYNNTEDFFITANEDYKLKLFNSNTFLCRKTVMSPNYGSPINKMCILPIQNTHQKYLAYSTQNSIIGVLKLPLSGNPYDNLGVMAHSGEIIGLCCSKDGHYVFSSDSNDTAINMWSVNVEVLEAQNAIGGKGNEPFINLLDPDGRDSAIYKEMEDYFYYAQLRTQGEDCIRNRIIEKKINISEVASILQAIGYYPSEQDIEDIKNEIKYSKVLETGDYVEYIEFEDLIRIYLNHRPSEDLTKQKIEEALRHSHEFEMPNIESEDDEENDIYYMGETDKQEYLENFKFKKMEENEASILKKILKSSSSSNSSLVSKPLSKEDEENGVDDSNININGSRVSIQNNEYSENKSIAKINKESKSSTIISDENSKKSISKLSSKSRSIKKLHKKKGDKSSTDLDDEDQTEARYITMKKNENERKEKMEKARQMREMIKTRENGKFSKSALLSLLQQHGESLSAELFDQYIKELLKDNSTNYNQLAEFFTLDEFVESILSFEEELIPETRIEKLNHENEHEIPKTKNRTIATNSHSILPQMPTYDINDYASWRNNTENDTEPYYVKTE